MVLAGESTVAGIMVMVMVVYCDYGAGEDERDASEGFSGYFRAMFLFVLSPCHVCVSIENRRSFGGK